MPNGHANPDNREPFRGHIGGFDLAARWMGWRTIWVSEIDPYASRVLAKHFPDAPNLGDITKIDWSQHERPDIICGGFPCQDISNAGKRAGITGARSGLWKEYARAIGDLRPDYVVVENVGALLVRGLDVVLGDLATLRYDAEWDVLSAADVGAPHLRERLWIVAYPNSERRDGRGCSQGDLLYPERHPTRTEQQRDQWLNRLGAVGETLAYSTRERQQERSQLRSIERAERTSGSVSLAYTDQSRSQGQRDSSISVPAEQPDPSRSGWWLTEPDVGRVAHGVSARVDRLKGLGNAIVPQCAIAGPFRRIAELEALAP